jgi:hypothetical protein
MIWLDGSSQLLKSNSINECMFVDAIDDCFLHQLVDFPTHQIKPVTLANTLDLIVADQNESISHIEQLLPLGNVKRGHICMIWDYCF